MEHQGKDSSMISISSNTIIIKLKLNLWLTAPKGATPVN